MDGDESRGEKGGVGEPDSFDGVGRVVRLSTVKVRVVLAVSVKGDGHGGSGGGVTGEDVDGEIKVGSERGGGRRVKPGQGDGEVGCGWSHGAQVEDRVGCVGGCVGGGRRSEDCK